MKWDTHWGCPTTAREVAATILATQRREPFFEVDFRDLRLLGWERLHRQEVVRVVDDIAPLCEHLFDLGTRLVIAESEVTHESSVSILLLTERDLGPDGIDTGVERPDGVGVPRKYGVIRHLGE